MPHKGAGKKNRQLGQMILAARVKYTLHMLIMILNRGTKCQDKLCEFQFHQIPFNVDFHLSNYHVLNIN